MKKVKLINSIKSELLKTKRSFANWLSLFGGFFLPLIFLIAQLKEGKCIADNSDNYWELHFVSLWQNMAAFILPMGIILACSLIVQIEFKNNAWKQLNVTAQSYSQIFLSKYLILFLITVKFFIYFNLGFILSGYIPCLVNGKVNTLNDLSLKYLILENIKIFITCLPLISLQFLLSTNFKNILVPIGIGLVLLIGTVISIRTKFVFISPFSLNALGIMSVKTPVNLYFFSIVYFIAISLFSYVLYILKKDKS